MSVRDFRRALRSSVGQVAAYQIHDGRGAAMSATLEGIIRGHRVTDGQIADVFGADTVEALNEQAARFAEPLIVPGGRGQKSTALISCRGVALYDLEYQPLCFSSLRLAETVTSLGNDPDIGTVVIHYDTPGGVVTGVPEAADAIYRARETGTKIVGVVSALSASAGYWLAAQSSEIICVPSGDVGSIGVFVMHAACAGMMEAAGIEVTFVHAGKYKVEGNPFEPLSDDARAYMQGEVDDWYRQFVRAVARGRGVSVAKVEADFGQGRTMNAAAAKKAGMVDRVMPLGQAMARVGVSMEDPRQGRRAESVDGEIFTEEQTTAFDEVEEPTVDDEDADGLNVRVAHAEDFDVPEPEITEAVIAEGDERRFDVEAARRRLSIKRRI